jgi:hypothetical protein
MANFAYRDPRFELPPAVGLVQVNFLPCGDLSPSAVETAIYFYIPSTGMASCLLQAYGLAG